MNTYNMIYPLDAIRANQIIVVILLVATPVCVGIILTGKS